MENLTLIILNLLGVIVLCLVSFLLGSCAKPHTNGEWYVITKTEPLLLGG
jgi:hypothetical protein